MPIKIQQTIDIELKPYQLAEIFADMNDDEQCVFFNRLGAIAKQWQNPIEFQLAAIMACDRLDDDGKRVLNVMSQMFATYDADKLLDACQTVVSGYETDGMEGMNERDKMFFEKCKSAIKKIG